MSEKSTYTLNDFDFDLPEELIAQYPVEKRDESRLFVLDRRSSSYAHKYFHDLPDILPEDSLLVFNNARVIPARIMMRRMSGALVEGVLARKLDKMTWLILTNRMKKIKPGEKLYSEKNHEIFITVRKRSGDFFEVVTSVPFTADILAVIGNMPLPPYIRREAGEIDESRYQTVYADSGNAVAAPTAGLHFTENIFEELKKRKIDTAYTTLDVSWGTFSPVRTENINDHRMHFESYDLPDETADIINKARSSGRNIVAVGTTSLRVLESTFREGVNVPGKGETDIFIYPPYKIRSISGMITNFHTPKSTLLMLVASFAGYELIMSAYREAVRERYRFFSYGDSMYIK